MHDQTVPEGVEALIRLSQDPEASVRDRATFALAELGDDSEAVRRALCDRVADPDYETRCEALVGLARRRDRRVPGPPRSGAIEAAHVSA